MSTRKSTPVLPALAVFMGVAIGVSVIASQLLGYLQTTAIANEQVGWWVPLFVFGIPTAVFVGIAVWAYFQT